MYHMNNMKFKALMVILYDMLLKCRLEEIWQTWTFSDIIEFPKNYGMKIVDRIYLKVGLFYLFYR